MEERIVSDPSETGTESGSWFLSTPVGSLDVGTVFSQADKNVSIYIGVYVKLVTCFLLVVFRFSGKGAGSLWSRDSREMFYDLPGFRHFGNIPLRIPSKWGRIGFMNISELRMLADIADEDFGGGRVVVVDERGVEYDIKAGGFQMSVEGDRILIHVREV